MTVLESEVIQIYVYLLIDCLVWKFKITNKKKEKKMTSMLPVVIHTGKIGIM